MERRHPAVEGADEELSETRIRRGRRLSELSARLQPLCTSGAIACQGIFAEVYQAADELDVGPFSLEDSVVIFIHKGAVEVRLLFADVHQTLSRGGLVILPPATATTLRVLNSDFTVVYLKTEQITALGSDFLKGRELVPQLDPDDIQLALLLGCIRDELKSELPGGSAYFESLAVPLTRRIYDRYGTVVIQSATFRGGLTAKQVKQAEKTILTDLDKSIPLAALAREAGLSPSHFCRAFKQSTGVSPHQWRLEQRFERARRLMADDQMTITSIALNLGFTSLGHFSAAFKRATGFPPSHYRRKVLS